jgi:hypothetical protein
MLFGGICYLLLGKQWRGLMVAVRIDPDWRILVAYVALPGWTVVADSLRPQSLDVKI